MSTKTSSTAEYSAAKVLAPDDICVSDYVAVLRQTTEIVSFCWSDDARLFPPETPVRVRWIPARVQPPRRVVAVCLPFVLVEDRKGKREQVDLRMTQLARVDPGFAEQVFRSSKAAKKRKKKRR
ncbi:hypothetical protein FYK55_07370 [Roseiconus nitratireducens]|uniref:Uncharacterized protein n=1 Tax=Roseiconus nitratireducens TaxID=2605748 RepID=A0A5M6DGY0_9BACT|nr:hypothetical protein [Roseiconus nitratireducens]KAA5545459.1 hypothetical protein FYK55_07370 [Roseiconus nitratireducens]